MRCNECANGGSSSLDSRCSHDARLDLFRKLFELLRNEGEGRAERGRGREGEMVGGREGGREGGIEGLYLVLFVGAHHFPHVRRELVQHLQ